MKYLNLINAIFIATLSMSGQSLDWAGSIENPGVLAEGYTKNALKIYEAGSIIQGRDFIAEANSNHFNRVDSINTLTKVKALKGYEYELGRFRDDNGTAYVHLLIWNNDSSIAKRELEFISETSTFDFDSSQINKRREDWVRLCNEHDAFKLVSELYTNDNIYYNHKPLIRGTEGVAKEYAYMNRESYNLDLTPIKVLPVHPELVFEIGQCSGSYNGKYIFVWKKGKDGVWRVYLDSNI